MNQLDKTKSTSFFIDDNGFCTLLRFAKNDKEKLMLNLFYKKGLTLNELTNLKEKKSVSQTTSRYVFSSRQSKKISNRRVEQIIKEIGIRAHIKLSPRILRRSFLRNLAIKGKSLDKAGVKISPKRFLAKYDFKKLMSVIGSKRDRLLFSLMYESGASVSEISDIRSGDISNTKIKIGDRVTTISSSLSKALTSFATGKLFVTRQKTSISARRIQQLLAKYAKTAGLGKITPKMLRYGAIANRLEKKPDMTSIRDEIGLKVIRAYHFAPQKQIKDRRHDETK